MRCDRIRELLLTDYPDGESNPEMLRRITEHLTSCATCAQLEKQIKTSASLPLKGAAHIQPSPAVWTAIRDKIIAERTKPTFAAAVSEKLQWLYAHPKPTFALASTLAVLILVTAMSVQKINTAKNANKFIAEQMEFFINLDTLNGTLADIGSDTL